MSPSWQINTLIIQFEFEKRKAKLKAVQPIIHLQSLENKIYWLHNH